ncbi:MAG: hypothetical protein M1835_005211 [Candelina submexicana]|nr:MAG: hypothetical protein M1835_005211 [Candelina submexicana]
MWMSDRPRTQQRLAIDLAGMVDVLPDENTTPFLEAFWITMAREWNGIDVLRMDKFLFLVRRYLNATFNYLARTGWGTTAVEQNLDVLSSIPLNLTDQKIPNGLRYHVIDIYVDELDKVDTPRTDNLPLQKLLEPLRRVGNDSPTKSVRTRANDTLADARLQNWFDVGDSLSRVSIVKGGIDGQGSPV